MTLNKPRDFQIFGSISLLFEEKAGRERDKNPLCSPYQSWTHSDPPASAFWVVVALYVWVTLHICEGQVQVRDK